MPMDVPNAIHCTEPISIIECFQDSVVNSRLIMENLGLDAGTAIDQCLGLCAKVATCVGARQVVLHRFQIYNFTP